MTDRRRTITVIGAGVAAFALVAVVVLLGNRGSHSTGGDRDDAVATGAPASERAAAIPSLPRGDARNSVFRLELQSADKMRAVQLGTAWAVGQGRLVTTGDAARGIAMNQEFYPTAVARHSLTRTPHEIVRMTLHPQYEAAASRLDQAVRNIERLKVDYDRAKEPAERQELERLLRDQDQAAILAADEAVNVNVAVLDVEGDLAGALSWNDGPGAAARVGQKLTLLGHAFSQTDFLVDPDHPVPPEKREGRLRHAEPPRDRQAPGRWLVGFDDPLYDQNWSGSPVLNSEGTVVGLYSRRTPPVAGATSGAIVTHDVTVMEGLKALMKKH